MSDRRGRGRGGSGNWNNNSDGQGRGRAGGGGNWNNGNQSRGRGGGGGWNNNNNNDRRGGGSGGGGGGYYHNQGNNGGSSYQQQAAMPEFACSTCRKDFGGATALMDHMDRANHGTWHYCDHCDWSFVTKPLLNKHVGEYHPEKAIVHGALGSTTSSSPAGPNNNNNNNNQGWSRDKVKDGSTQMSRDKSKHYDKIVKAFVDDPNMDEMDFPSTLTGAERHQLHKLAMHYGLGHKSSGPASDRILKLTKDENASAVAKGTTGGATRAVQMNGYQGTQPLDAPFLRNNLAEVEPVVKRANEEMIKIFHHRLQHPLAQPRRFNVQGGTSNKVRPSAPPSAKENAQSLKAFRDKLPSNRQKDKIINAVVNNQVTVVCGDTGCGKTTQIPQMLLDCGHKDLSGEILCTQPRRISALSVAQRVATERGEACGDSCGYMIRFESAMSSNTKIIYMTSGILLRRLQSDPMLGGVSVVVVDEVHERNVEVDFSLLLLRDLLPKNPKLRLVVMSATIQIDRLTKYFSTNPPPPLITIPGTLFPIKEFFMDDVLKWLKLGKDERKVAIEEAQAVDTSTSTTTAGGGHGQDADTATNFYANAKKAAIREQEKEQEVTVPFDIVVQLIEIFHAEERDFSGSILVFLPGWAQIDRISNLLKKSNNSRQFSILPLHSSLTTSEQQRVFHPAPRGFRKIILATNVAETSITIDDVTVVIDSCLHKGTTYEPSANTTALTSQLIAKANGQQRRGRAGRCRPGVCVHLLSRPDYKKLPDFLAPEMLRTPLEEICLQLKAVSQDYDCMDALSRTLDAPPGHSVLHAVSFLKGCGALDSKDRLTHLGRVLATMPVHPTLGKLLLVGTVCGVLRPIAIIAAALSGKSPFVKPLPHQISDAKRALQGMDQGRHSDHIAVLQAFTEWKQADRPHDFAYGHWLDHSTLKQMDRTCEQLMRLVQQSGFLRRKDKGDGKDFASRNAGNMQLIRFVLAFSLYPKLGVFEGNIRRSIDLICWDNKPTLPGKDTAIMGLRNKDVLGREFVVYFDRMRIESQLNMFDGSLIGRVHALLSVKQLDLLELDKVNPELLTDPECKYKPFDQESNDKLEGMDTLISVDEGKKIFTSTRKEAETIRNLRELLDFYFSYSLQRVDASLFPEELVYVLSTVLGDKITPGKAQPTLEAALGVQTLFQGGDGQSTGAATPSTVSAMIGDPSWLHGSSSDSEGDDDGGAEVEVEVEFEDDKVGALESEFGELLFLQRQNQKGNIASLTAPSTTSHTTAAPVAAASSSAASNFPAAKRPEKVPSPQTDTNASPPADVQLPTPQYVDPAIMSMGTAKPSSAETAPPPMKVADDEEDEEEEEVLLTAGTLA